MSEKLPEGWEYSTVKIACNIVNNLRKPLNYDERQNIKGIYPYYGPTGILDYISKYSFDGTFALIGEDGDHFLKFSEKQMTLLVHGKFNVNNHAHVIAGTKKCNAEWFALFFSHRDITSSITRQGAKRYKLNKDALKKLPILLPPLHEQQKIARILSTWDAAIDCVQKLLENSRQQKKALMQQLLTGKKRLPGFSGKWNILRIGDIASSSSEKNVTQENLPVLACSKHLGFVDSLTYFNKQIFSEDTSGYKLIRYGEFGYPANHVEEGAIGYQNIYDVALVSPIYVVFQTNESVDNTYLYLLLKTDTYRQKFSAATSASVDRRGSLRWPSFAKIDLRLPPLPEQAAIAKVLSSADAVIAQYETKLANLQSQKKALMQQLLTGKKRVKVDPLASEEVA